MCLRLRPCRRAAGDHDVRTRPLPVPMFRFVANGGSEAHPHLIRPEPPTIPSPGQPLRMSSFQTFLRAGHGPTLFAAFLYFTFSCCIWVLNGAMAPFISESFNLSPAQKGLMLSVPIIAGALMRFPL